MVIKKIAAFVLLAMSAAGFASAAAAPKAAAGGDADAGKAKVAVCTACHGADGNSAAPNFPKLAGQNAKYLIKQMQDVKSGDRPIPEMTGMLDALSDSDLADMVAFYESQKASVGAADPELVELGENLYRGGNRSKGLTACAACHSPTGRGNAGAGFPALSGQHAAYIAKQLKAFREGADYPDRGRKNDGESRIMRDTAAKMSDREIDAVSSYISGLH